MKDSTKIKSIIFMKTVGDSFVQQQAVLYMLALAASGVLPPAKLAAIAATRTYTAVSLLSLIALIRFNLPKAR